MSGLEYAHIPHCATVIEDDSVRPKPKLVTSMPRLPPPGDPFSTPTVTVPTSPTKQLFNLPNIILSSSLNLPTPPPTFPRDGGLLLSTREPLALQIMTVNFRRFVSKSGPVFWLQDRIEEVIMWKKGWKVTCTWMAIYSFLCYFPRIFLLLPHIVLISVLLTTHELRHSSNPESTEREKSGLPSQQPKEGTVDWYANLQAIQNLMGAVADLYDAALPFLPILSWATSNTSQLLSLLCVSLLLLLPVVIVIPLRPTLLCLGLLPFLITHPLSLHILPTLLKPLTHSLQSRVQRMIDDDNLTEKHWFADIHQVELWENERWSASTGWSKSNLKAGERKAWTRGRDGWSDVVSGGEGNVSSNLTFTLSSGYEFIETEDWRINQVLKEEVSGVDNNGWVYTNDSWLDPCPAPNEEWKAQGMTRRRRWTRRIYLNKGHSINPIS